MLGNQFDQSRTWKSAKNRTKPSAQIALEFVVLEDRAIPSVTGIVYQDYNANGTFDTNGQVPNAGLGSTPTAIDRGISGILVTAYDANNAVVTQATSDATGAYSLNTSNSGPLRVEFTNLPTGVFFGPEGTSANTAVQFVPAGNAGNVNLSLVRPEDFSPDNPLLVTSMYVFGGTTQNDFNPGTGVVVSFPNASGSEDADQNQENHRNPKTHDLALRYDNVGTTWGLTYDRVQNKIYAASYAKRHTSFGPNGPGAIYQSGTSGTGGTLFADLNAIFPNKPAGNLLDVFRDQNNNPVPFRQNYTSFLDYARDGLVRFVDSTGVTRDLGWDTIGKIALGIQRHIFPGRNGGDDLRLVMLAYVLEMRHRFIAWQHFARNRQIALGQFRHALFYCSQIIRREWPRKSKIVKKTILNYRSNGDLSARK